MEDLKTLTKQLKQIQKRHPLPRDTGSEFGKGFMYCMALWATHLHNHQAGNLRDIQFLINKSDGERAKILAPNPEPKYNYGKDMDYAIFWWKEIRPIYKNNTKKAFASEISTWANGASDHLYELETPKQFLNTTLDKKVKRLRSLGLEIGHGKGLLGRFEYTYEDFIKLSNLTGDIFKLTDKSLGVKQLNARFGEL